MCSGNYKLAFYFRRGGGGQGRGVPVRGGETNLIRQLALTARAEGSGGSVSLHPLREIAR